MSLSLRCGGLGGRLLLRTGLAACRLAGARLGGPGRRRIAFTGNAGNLQRPLSDADGQVRAPLGDAERTSHRGGTDPLERCPLVGEARRHVETLDVAAESVFLLRVGDCRAEDLRQLARDRLARE